jgi:lysozyme family protein
MGQSSAIDDNFEKAYKHVCEKEGGWVNAKGDSGGETYCGVARNFFPNERLWVVVDKMKEEIAFDGSSLGMERLNTVLSASKEVSQMLKLFYKTNFWDKAHLDKVAQLNYPIAVEIFDTFVNTGSVALKNLQLLLNAYNWDKIAPLLPDLVVDGLVGPKTVEMLRTILVERTFRNGTAAEVLFRRLNELQAAFYVQIASEKRHLRRFLDGWDLRIDKDLKEG